MSWEAFAKSAAAAVSGLLLKNVTSGALGGSEMMRQVTSRFCVCNQYVLHVQWRDVLTA